MENDICRICLNSSVTLVEIFAKREPGNSLGKPEPCLADMLNECADCYIRPNDELTQQICLGCVISAQNAFRFKRLGEQSYQHLVARRREQREEQLRQQQLDDDGLEWQQDNSMLDEQKPDNSRLDWQLEEEQQLDDSMLEEQQVANSMLEEQQLDNSMLEEQQLDSNSRLDWQQSGDSYDQQLYTTMEDQDMELLMPDVNIKVEPEISLLHKCNMCSKEFTDLRLLRMHKKWHNRTKSTPSATVETPYPVEIMSYKTETIPHADSREKQRLPTYFANTPDFSSENTIPLKTEEEKLRYECTICHKRFERCGLRTKHMRCHTGERPFKCSQCPKNFKTNDHLRRHLRLHPNVTVQNSRNVKNGKLVYDCSICHRRFATCGQRTKHMRTHVGERPFKCPHCPKNFQTNDHLRRHVRLHTGERPYECPYCEEAFVRSDYCNSHIKRFHSGSTSARQRQAAK